MTLPPWISNTTIRAVAHRSEFQAVVDWEQVKDELGSLGMDIQPCDAREDRGAGFLITRKYKPIRTLDTLAEVLGFIEGYLAAGEDRE